MVLRSGITPAAGAGLLALAWCLAGPLAPALGAEPCSAVTRAALTLEAPAHAQAEGVPALGVLAVLDCSDPQADPLPVLSPAGRPARLARAQALLLREEPEQVRQRLARLERAGLGTETCLRVLEGRIQENDSQWLVEMAWGPPQRRFMVNLFYDEEHFVYLRPGREPWLLRFKGGRLAAPPDGRPDAPPADHASPTASQRPVERANGPR